MEKITFTMTIPVEYLETLSSLLDGCLGTSDNDDFNDHIKPIMKKIENAIKKHKKKKGLLHKKV